MEMFVLGVNKVLCLSDLPAEAESEKYNTYDYDW